MISCLSISKFCSIGLKRQSSSFQCLTKLLTTQKSSRFQSTFKLPFNHVLRSSRLMSGFLISTGFVLGLIYDRNDSLKEIIPTTVTAKALVKKDIKPPLNDKSQKSISSQRFNFIADAVEKVAPSLVFIEIKETNSFFRGAISISNGSGFIIDPDGLIMTNAHVVANKKSVVVKLSDGRLFNGIVQFSDHSKDLALISINCHNLPSLQLGRSSTIRPGEWVVALGSPFCLTNSVTAGTAINICSKQIELISSLIYFGLVFL